MDTAVVAASAVMDRRDYDSYGETADTLIVMAIIAIGCVIWVMVP